VESGQACAIVRNGDQWVLAERPARVLTARGDEIFPALREIERGGFWAGYLAYDAGRAIERIAARTEDEIGLPDLAFVRFDDVRTMPALPALPELDVALGGGSSSLSPFEHELLVRRIHQLLADGDCYQVNLTRRVTYPVAPDPLALFGALAHASPAPHAMVCTFGAALPGVAIVSASPECFLRIDGRDVATRPIKGTASDVAGLLGSAKDHAENLMIVDLARNDLGRVCEYGSVHVPKLFEVESHPGLVHLVSTVRGRLRADIDLAGLIRATFPPASITGAPKPRVLQAIEDLEPVRRGVYCGAIGWIDASRRRAELAVAIRTFTIADGRTYLGLGGGIVADSCAREEWAETELKGARLLHAAGAYARERVDVT
jgi:para-aminobenzoate synthetase component 1